MTYFDVYIGDLEDSGSQKRVRHNTGAPKRLSPFFPGPGYYLRCQVLARIKDGTWPGWQADWGWVARLKPPELMSFIDQYYPADSSFPDSPWLVEQLTELRLYVQGLVPDREYALAASEL